MNKNPRLNTLIEKLKGKLTSFVVIDRKGEVIGYVQNLIIDAERHINLVLTQVNSNKTSRPLLLNSKFIAKIDPPNRAILVSINTSEIENNMQNITTPTPDQELSQMSTEPLTHVPESDTEAIIEDSSSFIAQAEDTKLESSNNSVELEEEIIRLLGERLVVDRSKRKVGEVIVRKEIETYMIQVPVRREKLIVEQVSPEHKQLASINLGQEEIEGISLAEIENQQPRLSRAIGELTVSGEFNSAKIASLLLNAIALERNQGYKKVRLEIVVENAESQKTYQEWFERCSNDKTLESEPNSHTIEALK